MIRNLFNKQPATFTSNYDLPESILRLTAATSTWPFLPPFGQSLVGSAKEHRVRLIRFTGLSCSNFAPVFYGSFQVREGVTLLEGYFALPLIFRIYYSLWLGLCLFFVVVCLLGAVFGTTSSTASSSSHPWLDRFVFGLFPVFLLLFFVLFAKISKWRARNDISFIATRVQEALQPKQLAQ